MIIETHYDSKLGIDLKISIGSSAQENWDIIKDSKQNDIWFHLQKRSSPHVVINLPKKTKIKDISSTTIKYAATLCKVNSAWKNHKVVTVMYTYIKNVRYGEDIGSVYTSGSMIVSV